VLETRIHPSEEESKGNLCMDYRENGTNVPNSAQGEAEID